MKKAPDRLGNVAPVFIARAAGLTYSHSAPELDLRQAMLLAVCRNVFAGGEDQPRGSGGGARFLQFRTPGEVVLACEWSKGNNIAEVTL